MKPVNQTISISNNSIITLLEKFRIFYIIYIWKWGEYNQWATYQILLGYFLSSDPSLLAVCSEFLKRELALPRFCAIFLRSCWTFFEEIISWIFSISSCCLAYVFLRLSRISTSIFYSFFSYFFFCEINFVSWARCILSN